MSDAGCCAVSCLITPLLGLSTEAATAQRQSAVIHQALPFLTATDSAFLLCVRVWAVIPIGLGSRNEHMYNLEKYAFRWMLRRGRTPIRMNSHFFGIFHKQPRSHGAHYSSSITTAVPYSMCVQCSRGGNNRTILKYSTYRRTSSYHTA